MKKLSVIVLFIVAGFVGASAQEKKADPDGPVMTFVKESYDFGEMVQGDSVKADFTFTNTGKKTLIITDVTASCGCTVPSWPKESIKPGQTSKITAVFHSAGKSGTQNKAITINSNMADQKVVFIKGNVKVPGEKK